MPPLEVWQEAFPPGQIIHAKSKRVSYTFRFHGPCLTLSHQALGRTVGKELRTRGTSHSSQDYRCISGTSWISQGHIALNLLLSHAHPRPLGERNEPLLEGYRILVEPAFGIKGFGVLKDCFGAVDKGTAHTHNGLQNVNHRKNALGKGRLTSGGMYAPVTVAPVAGTTRSKGEATPGLIRRDSLITAVFDR